MKKNKRQETRPETYQYSARWGGEPIWNNSVWWYAGPRHQGGRISGLLWDLQLCPRQAGVHINPINRNKHLQNYTEDKVKKTFWLWVVLALPLIRAGHRYQGWCRAAGIGIPASDISIRYRSIPVTDWVFLFRYRTGSGIGTLFHSGIGLTRCRIVRHSGIFKKCTYEGAMGYSIPCRSALLTVERDTSCLSIHSYWWC